MSASLVVDHDGVVGLAAALRARADQLAWFSLTEAATEAVDLDEELRVLADSVRTECVATRDVLVSQSDAAHSAVGVYSHLDNLLAAQAGGR